MSEGGHDIPEEVIERRYERGLKNLFRIYMPLCEDLLVVDNSGNEPQIVARAHGSKEPDVLNSEIWERIKKQ